MAAPKEESRLISVIMPCFNAERFVAKAVDSVLNQTYPSVELIVVDDGSTDCSLDILRSYGEQIRVLSQSNRGPYPARNSGVKVSRGEFIAFLDADDYWSTDFLEEMFHALKESRAVLTYCGWQNVGLPDRQSDPYIPPDYEAQNKLKMFLRSAAPWPIHAALVRRRIFEEVEGFHEDLPTCMDYDLWLRIGAARPIKRVPKVMAFYRHHNSSRLTSKQWRQARNVWLIKKKFVRSFPEIVASIHRKQLRQLINGALLQRGYNAYWKRDLVSAHKIFRIALLAGGWDLKDLKYLVPALLPANMYRFLIKRADRGFLRS